MKTDITIERLKTIFFTKEQIKNLSKKNKEFLKRFLIKKDVQNFVTKKESETFVTKDELSDAMYIVATKRETREAIDNVNQSMERLERNIENIMANHLDKIYGLVQEFRQELGATKVQTTRHDKEIKYIAKATNVTVPYY